MRVASEARTLEVIGAPAERTAFSIKHSGKAFRSLIDGLYSNKIESIVRELCANAFDSHQRVNQDKPFFVHTPTMLRSEFFLRDYGVGMDHNKVMTLYNTLFDSDKTDTDEEVGMFGLGSKSPFAYADQFFVTCYDGRESRHYSCALGEDDIPQIILMQTDKSKEPRGVRVGFSVGAGDYDAFAAAIKKTALAYTPAFESNITELPKLARPVFTGKGWYAYRIDKHEARLPAQWCVRQGCVIYPLASSAELKLPTGDSRYQFLIEAPIGTVQVTTSREAVSYKPKVVAFLNARAVAIQEELVSLIWKKVKGIKDVVAYFEKLKEVKPNFLAERFTHPHTGLDRAAIDLPAAACYFDVSLSADNRRWEFLVNTSVALSENRSGRYYVIEDIGPLLDVNREEGARLSKSEHRRLSRLCRAYLESLGRSAGKFLLHVNWTDDFWSNCFGNATREVLTFDALRNAVPRRLLPHPVTLAPPIKGMALAMKPGDQKPIYEIEAKTADVAWISADLYRRRPEQTFDYAKKLGVDRLYIVSASARDSITASKVPHLGERATKFYAKKGVTIADYYGARSLLIGYGAVENLRNFATALFKADEAQYDLTARGPSSDAVTLRALRPLIKADVAVMDAGGRDNLAEVMKDHDEATFLGAVPSSDILLATTRKAVPQQYEQPSSVVAAFLSDLDATIIKKNDVVALARAIRYLRRQIPSPGAPQ